MAGTFKAAAGLSAVVVVASGVWYATATPGGDGWFVDPHWPPIVLAAVLLPLIWFLVLVIWVIETFHRANKAAAAGEERSRNSS